MKHIIIFVLGILLSLQLPAQQTFKLSLSSSGYDEAIDAFRTHDGGYRIVGNSVGTTSTEKRVWIIALDSNANFLWQKSYNTQKSSEATAALLLPGDSLLICGSSIMNYPATKNGFLLGLSSSGVPFLNKHFGGPDWDQANAIAILHDSIILVGGHTFNVNPIGHMRAIVWGMNFQGDSLLASWSWLPASSYQSIDISADGNIICGGNGITQNSDSMVVITINYDGALMQLEFLNKYVGKIENITATTDSGCIVTGSYLDTASMHNEPFLIKLDKNLNHVWWRYMTQGQNAEFHDCIVESSGAISIIGKSDAYSVYDDNFYAARFTHDGWYLDGALIGGPKKDWGKKIKFYPQDSSYLVVGSTENFNVNFQGILLAQLDYNFNYDTTTRFIFVSGLDPNKSATYTGKIFPNPASNYLQLDLDQNFENIPFQIIDLQGKIIQEGILESNTTSKNIPIQTLTSGLYFLKIKINKQYFSLKFIKQ